jgi:RibD C-terminal domain
MRKIIAALITSLDGLIEGPDGEPRTRNAVGGATLVSSLINAGLVDELRIVVQPILLGRGKALFKDVKERHALTLPDAKPLQSGRVRVTYRTGSSTSAVGAV